MRFARQRALLFLAAIGTSSCLDLTGAAGVGGRLYEILVSDDGATVRVGDTVRLTAIGHVNGLQGLFSFDPVRDARWSVSDTAIASLETPAPPAPDDTLWRARTLVRGRRPGSVTVSATARGIRGDAVVRVLP